MNKISEFMIGFYEPTNEQEISDITDKRKLLEDIKVGIYFIEYKGQTIGMSRYSGESKIIFILQQFILTLIIEEKVLEKN